MPELTPLDQHVLNHFHGNFAAAQAFFANMGVGIQAVPIESSVRFTFEQHFLQAP